MCRECNNKINLNITAKFQIHYKKITNKKNVLTSTHNSAIIIVSNKTHRRDKDE